MNLSKRRILITDFGAIGNGVADCTSAFQAAVDRAAANTSTHGGTVLVPPGDWLSGSIILRSGVNLHLQDGATLRAGGDPGLFPYHEHRVRSRMDVFPRRALFFGNDLEEISFTGGGTIEAGGGHKAFQDGVGDSPDRPYGLHLVGCRKIRIEGLTWRDSAYWMMRFFQCREIHLRNLTVFNHCNINNDGIDIDSSEDVEIEGCRVDSSDDGIVVKSESPRLCRRVRVRRCVVSSHASALKLGTGSVGGFEDIAFEDCEIRPSESTRMHHIFGYWKGMTGVDIAEVDGGIARKIAFRRIQMCGVANPVFVRLGNRHSTISIPSNRRPEEAGPALAPVGPGCLEDLEFSDLDATEAGPFPVVISGYEGHPIRNVVLRNIKIACRLWEEPDGWNRKPDWNPAAYPCVHLLANGGCLPASGVLLRHVEGVELDGLVIDVDPRDPREGMVFEFTDQPESSFP